VTLTKVFLYRVVLFQVLAFLLCCPGFLHAATVIFLTSTTTSTWSVPADWNSSNNTIEAIGGGGGGGGGWVNAAGGGGGGGAYSEITDIPLTSGHSVTISIGAGGAGGAAGNSGTAGSGGDTYFNGSTCAAASVCAKGGGGGSSSGANGSGGAGGSGVGSTKNSGGDGGTYGASNAFGAGGGGGAGGPNGVGAIGGSTPNAANNDGAAGGGGSGGGTAGSNTNSSGGNGANGGNNDAGSGGGSGGVFGGAAPTDGSGTSGHSAGGGGGGSGAVGATPGTAGADGGAGQEWDATHGSGGGGGGGGGHNTGYAGGAGGTYGGGGGGGGASGSGTPTGGNGAQGIIVITYTPIQGRIIQLAHSNTVALSNGLVGYWTFDGPTLKWKVGTAADSSGNGNNGQLIGMSTSTSPTAGKIGQALKFNGLTSVIEGPSSFSSTYFGNDFTISAWIKSTDTSTNGKVIVSTYAGFGGNEVDLQFKHSGAHQQIGLMGFFTNADSLPNGKWHLITATRNTAGLETIYLDGVQIDQTSGTSGTLTYTSNNQVVIGGDNSGNNPTMNGSIDDVRIYNRVLSYQEIKQLYSLGKVTITTHGKATISH